MGRGFSLVEALIVGLVVTIVSTISIPRSVQAGRHADESAAKERLALVREAVLLFRADTDCYPLTLADLGSYGAPEFGYSREGAMVRIDSARYHGPYWTGTNAGTELEGWIEYDPKAHGNVFCPRPGLDATGLPYRSW